MCGPNSLPEPQQCNQQGHYVWGKDDQYCPQHSTAAQPPSYDAYAGQMGEYYQKMESGQTNWQTNQQAYPMLGSLGNTCNQNQRESSLTKSGRVVNKHSPLNPKYNISSRYTSDAISRRKAKIIKNLNEIKALVAGDKNYEGAEVLFYMHLPPAQKRHATFDNTCFGTEKLRQSFLQTHPLYFESFDALSRDGPVKHGYPVRRLPIHSEKPKSGLMRAKRQLRVQSDGVSEDPCATAMSSSSASSPIDHVMNLIDG